MTIELTDLFEQRFAQAIDFPVSMQPENWRTWDNELIEANISKEYAQANMPVGQLFRFEETRPSEGYVRQVGRITPDGIFIVIRHAEGLRAIVSGPLMQRFMRDTANIPSLDSLNYILINY